MLCVGGIAAHALHALILTTFPYVRLTSVSFLGACAMLVFNHWQALQFFQQHWHPVSQVLAYFTTCVWPVPLLLLVSLCANDNVLPTVNERSPLLSEFWEYAAYVVGWNFMCVFLISSHRQR